MNLQEFMNQFLEAAIHGGIATENPSKENLIKFENAIDTLKRNCDCYIPSDEDFKKLMPSTYEWMNEGMQHAETGRNSLREVGQCCLSKILLGKE